VISDSGPETARAPAAIQRLDQVVADAIAAGEVVERPASVVKELVENALDAGARSIQVEMDGGGLERILVVDDGCGIAGEQLELAFTRHATSKLSSINDLARIGSLGFRGEALASIAAVARVECRSCCHGAPEGARITIDHGTVGAADAAPPVPGTRVEVRGLFENTPARRAFLKRPATELAAAVRILGALALCHPHVRVRLTADGRRLLDLPGSGSLDTVYSTVSRARAALLKVAGSRGETSVSGVIVEPAGLRRSREHLYLAVNRRPVSSRSLAFAVEQAYRGLAEPGMFPGGALMVELPPEVVDVNVHPTKREVRLRDERMTFSLVQEAVVRALSGSGSYGGEGLLPSTAVYPSAAPSAGWEAVLEGANQRSLEAATAGQVDLLPITDVMDADASLPGSAYAEVSPAGTGSLLAEASAVRHSPGDAPSPLLRGPFRLVGQVMESYIAAEGPNGLVVVDQHAAHERIVYNRLASTGRQRQLQPLLVPILLRLTPVQAACLDESRADLLVAGLEVEDFGTNAARLVAYDPVLPGARLDRLALEVLDSLVSEGRELDLHRRLERALYTVACHSAVRFGQRLAREEMEQLLRDLEVADPGITCPHGRPTLLEIPESRLRREFRRSPA
jgi:DNA mismatch repair protein MutL